MNPSKELEKPIPALPVVTGEPFLNIAEGSLESIYILHCVSRAPNTSIKYFRSTKPFKEVMQIARQHCEKMGIRFLYCSPFLTDLAAEEKRHMTYG